MKALKTLLFVTAIALSATWASAQSFVTNGLVCYYPFDGNTLDASGVGNNPTSVVATPAPDRFGNPTNALAFDGVTSGIITSGFFNQSKLQIQTNGLFGLPETLQSDLTESIWFCPSNNLTITNLYFLMCDGSPSGAQYSSALYDGNAGLSAYYYNGTGYSVYTTQTNFASNVWYHIVGTITSTSVSVYLNGVLQANKSTSGYREVYGNLNIGSQQWSSGGYRFGFPGRLDDVRIYNRALSSNEVSQLYALEQPPLPSIGLASAYVPTFSNLETGSAYQLQVSPTAEGVFTNYGDPFVATNSSMNYPGYFVVTNSVQLYFRVSQ